MQNTSGTHSTSACLLCRQRRVKCDKTLPTCTRCAKSQRTCPGYDEKRVFINHFKGTENNQSPRRHRHSRVNVSTSEQQASSSDALGSVIDTSPTSIPTSPHHPITSSVDSGLELEDSIPSWSATVSSHTGDSLEYFDLDIDTYYANGQNACGFNAQAEDIRSQSVTSFRSGVAEQSSLREESFDGAYIMQDELVFLMRVFVEVLGPWMDLLDLNAYFSHSVPVQATIDKLLQFALAAVASKQAAYCLSSRERVPSTGILSEALSVYPSKNANEWFYDAAKYYDQGVMKLRTSLAQLPIGSTLIAVMPTQLGTDHEQSPAHTPVVEAPLQNMLTAISIFSLYENLDKFLSQSSRHLTGFLALIQDVLSPSPASYLEQHLVSSSISAGRAVFWYFARKEMFAAHAHQQQPSLDPSASRLWIAAGVPHELLGHHSSGQGDIARNQPHVVMQEPMTTVYILIWLATRAVQLVYETWNTASPQQGTLSTLSGASAAAELSLKWKALREHLAWWFQNRHYIFRPYTANQTGKTVSQETTLNRKVFFASPLGAAAMQIYHFAQILLLLNQPIQRAREPVQLRMLRQRTREIEAHSKEIYAIASCTTTKNIQRQMSHPLQLAAASFDDETERAAILQLLTKAAAESCSPLSELTTDLA